MWFRLPLFAKKTVSLLGLEKLTNSGIRIHIHFLKL